MRVLALAVECGAAQAAGVVSRCRLGAIGGCASTDGTDGKGCRRLAQLRAIDVLPV